MALFTEPFNDPLFSVADLTTFVNKEKYVPQMVSQMMLASEQGAMTTRVLIEERQGTLDLLPYVPRGGVPEQNDTEKRVLRGLDIPCIKVQDFIWADELLAVRAPGELRKWAYREIVDEKLRKMVRRLDASREVHRVNMVRGLVNDAKTAATLYNIFTEFGVSQETEVDFDLDNGSPTQGQTTLKINALKRTMRDNAEDLDVEGKIVALCSAGFWDLLVTHKELIDSFKFDGTSEFLRRSISSGSFEWRGITWIEYSRSAGGSLLVPADKALFFPTNVPGLYETHYAPPDFLSDDLSGEVRGLPRYVSQPTIDPMNPNNPQFVRLDLQSNPLDLCVRPKVLMIGRKT